MLCVVMGIPGVGKTTVLKTAAEKSGAKIINFGDVMFEEAKKRGLVKERDLMRKLPQDLQKELQRTAAETIHAQSRSGNIIVDTHASIKTPKGFLPGLPEAVVRAMSPNVLVLVECDSREIFDRRAKDSTRSRDADTIEEIEEHQMMNRAFSAAYAELTGATVFIVKNPPGKADEAGSKIAALFK